MHFSSSAFNHSLTIAIIIPITIIYIIINLSIMKRPLNEQSKFFSVNPCFLQIKKQKIYIIVRLGTIPGTAVVQTFAYDNPIEQRWRIKSIIQLEANLGNFWKQKRSRVFRSDKSCNLGFERKRIRYKEGVKKGNARCRKWPVRVRGKCYIENDS